MANKYRAEAEMQVGGQTYWLRFGTNEVAEVENVLDLGNFVSMFPRGVIRLGFRQLRAVLWAALRLHHPEVSLADVGNMIDTLGDGDSAAGFAAGNAVAVDLLKCCFPPDEPESEGGKALAGGTVPEPGPSPSS
jgi:hypothetical protein